MGCHSRTGFPARGPLLSYLFFTKQVEAKEDFFMSSRVNKIKKTPATMEEAKDRFINPLDGFKKRKDEGSPVPN